MHVIEVYPSYFVYAPIVIFLSLWGARSALVSKGTLGVTSQALQ